MKNAVLVIGSINQDLVVSVKRIPRPGETLLGGNLALIPGGKGANQACAAARLGAQTTFVGKVGVDPFAAHLREHLRTMRVDDRYLFVDRKTPSGAALIAVAANGENSIIVAPGTNFAISVADLNRARPAFTKAAVLLLQQEVPEKIVLSALKLARAAKVRTILDPAPARKIEKSAYPLIDIISPNESETEALTGVAVASLADAERAAQKFIRLGVREVVLKLGARGALYVCGRNVLHVPGVRVRAVDTTAAGDVFTGALGAQLAAGEDVHSAIRFANHAAAISVTRFGAGTSLPDKRETDTFLRTGKLPRK